ncbi:glutamate racemase [Neisseria meningitidis]|uniref:Glutamate racemase n=1 Tax=Neisseria meningitidis TaxID=487 RepID=A0AB36RV40_NEIME|nr:glutamate racemase [Neisseria meningitidis]ARC12283.1 glutamate racemase [Neisseria meningitidis]ATL34369.1 glutamate racemase [Neisseria meningitidis]ATL37181.1 glutamate racemase [Neisseria meningitidis]AUX05532.1 glutamate racemase [Neisseria meningitidis]MBG8581159.1 glutamate racemase [Neisseria meningitidis]
MADRRGRRSANRAPGGSIAVHYNSQIRILLSDGNGCQEKAARVQYADCMFRTDWKKNGKYRQAATHRRF